MEMFAVMVEEGSEDRDGKPSVGPIYRNILSKNDFPPPDPELSTAWDVLRVSVEKYPRNRMLGWREFSDGKFGPYLWKTYKEVYEEVLHVGSALRASGAKPGSRIGIYGSNCPQWIVAMEGKEHPSEPLPPQPFNICTIMYTSGTSGDPKGVILTHENIALNMTADDVYISFLPLAHVLDRMIEEYFFHKGASVGYYHGVKARLGGRIRLIVSGAAPLSSEVEEFLRVTSCAYVVQGYGLTETCGLATVGFPDEMCMIGTVGSPFVYSELRLEEVPEMGYNPLGDPSCGEICVRGKTTFTGYYKNPELTAEAFKDGWFHTGDIGEMLPNGVVKIIDRKKNLIKLSQGEYVAVECLEKFYGITPIVEDIWVYGDSFRSMLVAVVVPHEENTKRWAYQNGHRGSLSELCFLKQLQDNVLLQLKSTAERTKLRGFEYIKGIILEPQPFDAERDLVTATLKKKRDKLHKYYKVVIFLICPPLRNWGGRGVVLRPMRTLGRALLVTSSQICTISTATLNYMINGYIREGNINDARKLFDRNPFSRDVVSWNSMFSGYIKHDQIQHAQHLFDQMLLRDVVSWNAMLSGLHKIKNPQGIYHCFLRMGRDGLRPNDFTFSIVISALTNTGFNLMIPQLHGLALRSALNSCVFVGSSLMRGYTDLGDRKGLYLVFDEILAKNVTSWNALILGYMELGLSGEARRAFEMMPEKNIISWTTLVNGYIRNKELDEARSIFNGNCERNVVLWTVMVSGYVQNGKFVHALELFLLMLKSGTQPNQFTFSSALDACSGCSSLLMGKQVHSNMLKSGIPFDVVLSTALVDMYAKCGDIEAAFCFFESVPKKDLATWNSVIGGYARHGLATRALEEFERMINGGVKPDEITFVNVLSACVHGGLVEEGERHFNSMTTKYGIKAGMEHYACMVDLYGRAGFLETAVKLIEGMPFKPDVVVWGALLAACSLHSSLELGEFAAKRINTLQKDHPAVYSMLSKIHGEQGIWGTVIELRKVMKERRAKMQNAGSWIEASSGP
ncbi:hypothetical protein HYC85_032338 [Camellia sinensis]|uniref:AMP-dependent synthetase/ligase domain-containing protein n=1 Tax=Camellia sinensis TaxID=4442 RepID=A0A7J7FSZ3_CAMSI|nr:hypothetical protein HYC85_032338 [Camellia sinensis]